MDAANGCISVSYRCPHSGAQVGRARSHIAVVFVPGKLDAINALYCLEHLIEVIEDIEKIGALLHAHDSELVLFAKPDDAHFVVRLPASAPVWPIRRNARALEVLQCEDMPGVGQAHQCMLVGVNSTKRNTYRISVHVLEHHVRIHQLLVLFICDQVWIRTEISEIRRQRIYLTTILLLELIKSREHALLKLNAFVLAHFSWEVEAEKIPAHADSHGEFVLPELFHIVIGAVNVPVGDVLLVAGFIAVIIANDLVKETTKLGIVQGSHGIATQTRVGVVQASLDALVKSHQIYFACVQK